MDNKRYEKRKLDELMTDLYMKYAKYVIVGRSCVLISGLKPVQQRILFAMKEIKAMDGTRRKCARIVGDTMGKYHPHGDSSIYGALCNMSDINMTMNNAWVRGQGNLGKSWSNEMITPADMRYTEAQLSPLAAQELFNGMSDGSAIMIDNFDKTEKEPLILPVSFPSILVNSTSGIAVAISTDIPNYGLKNVCEATKYLIEKEIANEEVDSEEFIRILGEPDFPTGGTLSINHSHLQELALRGKSKRMYLTGSYSATKGAIKIHEIPYNTSIERVVKEIKEGIRDGLIPGARSASNSTGKDQLSITVDIARGAVPEEVMRDIKNHTSFRTTLSYNIGFIHWNEEKEDFEYKECGALELLEKYWIPWSVGNIRRVYKYKVEKSKAKIHEQSIWIKLRGHVKEVLDLVSSNTRTVGKELIMEKYGVDLIQVNYLYSMSISGITEDGIEDNLANLDKLKAELDEQNKFLLDDTPAKMEIINNLERVAKKFGGKRKSNTTDLAEVEADKMARNAEDVVIEEGDAWVAITEKGFIKRTMDESEYYAFESKLGQYDKIIHKTKCDNQGTLLIFSTDGFCYKLPVHRIENSRTEFKESLWRLVDKYEEDTGDILMIEEFNPSKNFNIIYNDGTGIKVSHTRVGGPRARYRSLYAPFKNGDDGMLYNHNQFFVVTKQGNAGWVDLTYFDNVVGGARDFFYFKIPRLKNGDGIRGFMSVRDIKYFDKIDLDRFKRDYCVKMGEDAKYILNTQYKQDVASGLVVEEAPKIEPTVVKAKVVEETEQGIMEDVSVDDGIIYSDDEDYDEDDVYTGEAFDSWE